MTLRMYQLPQACGQPHHDRSAQDARGAGKASEDTFSVVYLFSRSLNTNPSRQSRQDSSRRWSLELISHERDLPLPSGLWFSLAGPADGLAEHPYGAFFSPLLIKGCELTS